MNHWELAKVDSSVEDDPVGTYGMRWLDFMQGNHPELVKKMIASGTLAAVARSVDERAWEYDGLLEKQYLATHPSPNTFEENVKYHTTKNFYVDSAVMREKVLIPFTQP